jgi:hypothetical protein
MRSPDKLRLQSQHAMPRVRAWALIAAPFRCTSRISARLGFVRRATPISRNYEITGGLNSRKFHTAEAMKTFELCFQGPNVLYGLVDLFTGKQRLAVAHEVHVPNPLTAAQHALRPFFLNIRV